MHRNCEGHHANGSGGAPIIRPRKSLTLLGTALALAFIAVACGSSIEPEAERDTLASQPAAEPTAARQPPPNPTAAPEPPPDPTPLPEARVSTGTTGDELPAPELTGTGGWINSEPFDLASQRGKVVLVDFWTYTCINCIRTLPYLKDWHAKYADRGLVILGVHTPEFEFEKDYDNVVEASGEFGLLYPIVQDNDFGTWRAFRNRFWPAKYLIDKDGLIRYTHFGEGAYQETEEKIRELLAETGTTVAGVELNQTPDRELVEAAFTNDPDARLTREIYAGYERNYGAYEAWQEGGNPPYVLQADYYRQYDQAIMFEDPGGHRNHFVYFHGLWHNGPESIRHGRETDDYGDYIALRFVATSVNAVLTPADGTPVEVRVTIDGRPLVTSEAGGDVMFDGDGQSYIVVDEDRLYRLVEIPEYGKHELKLSSNSPAFELFAFTFGAFDENAGS